MTTIASTPQSSKVYAYFDQGPVVFACQVNGAFSTHDKIYEFNYDNVSAGSYGAALAGMTVLLGTTPGGHEAGLSFVRKEATTSRFFVGETSEVAWEDNLYVTVLAEFAVWPEHLVIKGESTVYMKHDVAYTNQHSVMKPVPILGADRVAKLDALGEAVVNFDGGGSYVFGSTIASHVFSCTGASISGGSTATPTMTFNAAGRYLVTYTVTSAAGASSSTYRTVYVYEDAGNDANVKEITLGALMGDYDGGGWSFSVTVLGTAAGIRERAKVILFGEEWYGGVSASFGPVAGAENIIAAGWVNAESLTVNFEQGLATFDVQGTQFWLQAEYSFIPFGIRRKDTQNWIQMSLLTVDKALWNLVMWRTTMSNCVDVFLSGDSRAALELAAPSGSLWEQMKVVAYNSILASPCCDRYGRLFVETESVLLPPGGRAGIPLVGSLTSDDFESLDVERVITTPTSQVVLSGVSVNGKVGKAYFSLSRGHIPMHYGQPKKVERLLLSNQSQANQLAGLVLEKDNVPYRFQINNLLYNNRTVDVCPRQFVGLTLAANENPRQIGFDGKVTVKVIDLGFEDGEWRISWNAEPETAAVLAVNGDIPGTGDGTNPWTPPALPPIPVPPVIDIPDEDPGTVITPMGVVSVLFYGGATNGLWAMDTTKSPPTWIQVTNTEWTADELNSLVYYEADPVGNIFVANNKKIWKMKMAEYSARQLVADETTFEALYPNVYGSFYYQIHATGMKPTENGFCCLVGIDYAGLSGGYRQGTHLYNGSSLPKVGDFVDNAGRRGLSAAANAPGGNFVFNDDYAYAQVAAGYVFSPPGQVLRLVSGLNSYDGTSYELDLNGSYYNGAYFLAAAKSQDILYAIHTSSRNPIKITDRGQTATSLSGTFLVNSGEWNSIDCDPTGQYVMLAVGLNGSTSKVVYTSGDEGATWNQVTNLPSLSYDGRAPGSVQNLRVMNLGEWSKWVVAFSATVQVDATHSVGNYFHIFFTTDFGVNWENWAGNLHADPFNPGPGKPRIVRNV